MVVKFSRVTPEFKKWAKGFSGCSGGNIRGEYWFCGIEWAGTLGNGDIPFKPVTEPSAWKDCVKYRKSQLKSQYNQKAVKLYAAMTDRNIKQWRNIGLAPMDLLQPIPTHLN